MSVIKCCSLNKKKNRVLFFWNRYIFKRRKLKSDVLRTTPAGLAEEIFGDFTATAVSCSLWGVGTRGCEWAESHGRLESRWQTLRICPLKSAEREPNGHPSSHSLNSSAAFYPRKYQGSLHLRVDRELDKGSAFLCLAFAERDWCVAQTAAAAALSLPWSRRAKRRTAGVKRATKGGYSKTRVRREAVL